LVGVASLGFAATSPCADGYRVWAFSLHPVHLEASALQHAGAAGLHGRSPLLRLQSDERLVALIRRGNHHAFEALVARYQSRLLAFCRHMLSSREDAEDVLQEVFAAAFNAMLADEREINVRPWLYRIARNRSLNHLRRAQAVGMDSMDIHLSEGGLTTADKVHKREEFRLLIADVQDLPETQRTALLLREIDALSYDQIAEAMETTVPSVKSLLVRARVSLAEAAEARLLSCDEVRLELGEVAEGLARTSAPVRRHLRTCDRCTAFRKQLRSTNKALASLYPVGPLILLKKLLVTHIGTSAAAGSAATAGGAAASSAGAGAALQVGFSAFAGKAAAGLAAAAIVTAGAVEVQHAAQPRPERNAAVAQLRPAEKATAPAPKPVATAAPVLKASAPQPIEQNERKVKLTKATERKVAAAKGPKATPTPAATSTPAASATPTTTSTPAPTGEAKGGDTTALPTDTLGTAQPGSGSYTPAAPTPAASGPVLSGVQPAPQPETQPSATPVATPEQTATPEAPPAPTVTPAPVQTPSATPSPSATPESTPPSDDAPPAAN
jgi:RNA polymerase sigma factor (sigma-70 family)